MVVIDGLDEMSEPEITARQLVQPSLICKPGVRIAILSRYSKGLMRCFDESMHLAIRPSDIRHDIENYVRERAQRLPLDDKASRQNLVKAISDKVDGMFLWAHVVMQDLETATTFSDVEDILLRCPPGLAATYDRFILGLASEPAHRRRLAKELLQWVLCSFRPLSITELEIALSIQLSGRLNDERAAGTDHKVFRTVITEICNPFLSVNPVLDQIRPIHHSFREYLTSGNLHIHPKSESMTSEFFIGARSHTEIALRCLQHATRTVETISSESRNTFWAYAMTSWCHHTILGSYDSELERNVCIFLSTPQNRRKWLYWMLFEYREPFAFATIFKWQEDLGKWAASSELELGLHASLIENDWSMDILELLLSFPRNRTGISHGDVSSRSFFYYRKGVTYFEKMMVIRGLARRLNRKNRLDEAVQMLERRGWASEPYERTFLMNILGILLDQQGLSGQALEKHREAHSLQEQLQGVDHMETLWSMNEMGRMYRHLGSLKDSESMHRGVLVNLTKTMPEDHPEIIWTINTLATTLRLQGRLEEALALHLQAFHSREECLGQLHAHTLWSCSDIAKCFRDRKMFSSALVWYQKALDGRMVSLGPDHADTLWSMNNLGSVKEELGDLDGALVLQRQALETQERILGHDHSHACWTRKVIGKLMANTKVSTSSLW